MKELTKAEEQVMQYLWNIGKGFLKDIVNQFPNPQPASTTVATVIKGLVDKGFVGYETFGKSNEYFPLVEKKDYARTSLNKMVKSFFGNSVNRFSSFFARENKLSIAELEHLKQMIEEQIEKQKEEKNE